MKKITLLFSLLAVSIGNAQSLPIDFDDALDANFTAAGGATFTVTADGTNAIGQIIGGADQYNSRIDLALDTYIDMTTAAKTFTFEYYTTEAVAMNGLLQIGAEEAGGFAIEKGFVTDGNIGWETITIDFSDATNGYPNAGDPVVFGQYAQISVFTNFADNGVSTYWIDDIAGAANGAEVLPPAAAVDPIDGFEGNGNITWTADGGTGMNIAFANPSVTGINTSATVLEYSDTAQQYANIQFDLNTDTAVKYDLSTKNVFTLKVYVPTPDVEVTEAKILWLKLQDASLGGNSWQTQVVSEQAYEYDVWQELTFDFSAIATNTAMSRLVVQFNGENNYEIVTAYIDDLFYGEGGATASIDKNNLSNVSLYPSPAQNELTISAENTIQNASIYNVLGRKVQTFNVNAASKKLDVSALSTGIYILKYTVDNVVGSMKFIKE